MEVILYLKLFFIIGLTGTLGFNQSTTKLQKRTSENSTALEGMKSDNVNQIKAIQSLRSKSMNNTIAKLNKKEIKVSKIHHPKIILTYYAHENLDNKKPFYYPLSPADSFQRLLMLFLMKIATEENLINEFNQIPPRKEKLKHKMSYDFFENFHKRVILSRNGTSHKEELQSADKTIHSKNCEMCQNTRNVSTFATAITEIADFKTNNSRLNQTNSTDEAEVYTTKYNTFDSESRSITLQTSNDKTNIETNKEKTATAQTIHKNFEIKSNLILADQNNEILLTMINNKNSNLTSTGNNKTEGNETLDNINVLEAKHTLKSNKTEINLISGNLYPKISLTKILTAKKDINAGGQLNKTEINLQDIFKNTNSSTIKENIKINIEPKTTEINLSVQPSSSEHVFSSTIFNELKTKNYVGDRKIEENAPVLDYDFRRKRTIQNHSFIGDFKITHENNYSTFNIPNEISTENFYHQKLENKLLSESKLNVTDMLPEDENYIENYTISPLIKSNLGIASSIIFIKEEDAIDNNKIKNTTTAIEQNSILKGNQEGKPIKTLAETNQSIKIYNVLSDEYDKNSSNLELKHIKYKRNSKEFKKSLEISKFELPEKIENDVLNDQWKIKENTLNNIPRMPLPLFENENNELNDYVFTFSSEHTNGLNKINTSQNSKEGDNNLDTVIKQNKTELYEEKVSAIGHIIAPILINIKKEVRPHDTDSFTNTVTEKEHVIRRSSSLIVTLPTIICIGAACFVLYFIVRSCYSLFKQRPAFTNIEIGHPNPHFLQQK